ncbi:hypothetical protein [Metabacillus malikii]|uniref:O-antigen ligase family protein n=1 Tax=Metabacillus malikii TaxID=1504265 RepID=A0ABT9ZGM3_9BACI|nr:hypothetical protein [Metabacillus malikii]MDQ0231432.1 hypothetical protein [Metabacillus malikii]
MNKFEKILLTIFFIEVFVGGGGRLIDFGILSIRQVIFLILLVTYCIRVLKMKAFLDKEVNTFIRFNPLTIGVYLLIGWFGVSAVIGLINNHPISIIVMDFFRVSYFLVYFPLAYYISKDKFSINRILGILKYSAFAVALFTIAVSLLGKTVFSANFSVFYDFMNTIMNDDLFFRPSNSVFYKSHLFVVIGLVLSLNAVLSKKHSWIDIANLVFCSFSAILSETRGFLLAFMISILMIIIIDTKIIIDPVKGFIEKCQTLFRTKQFLKKMVILVFVFISVPFLYEHMTLDRFEEEVVVEEEPADTTLEEDAGNEEGNSPKKEVKKEVNDISVNARMSFILASKEILLSDVKNLIIGTGYGTEIDGRVNGIEMSFLDILVEQGLIGFTFWLFLFLLPYFNYYSIFKRGAKLSAVDISLMSAFMGLLLLTNINPFINNPIGISFFLIVLIVSQAKRTEFMNKSRNEVRQ